MHELMLSMHRRSKSFPLSARNRVFQQNRPGSGVRTSHQTRRSSPDPTGEGRRDASACIGGHAEIYETAQPSNQAFDAESSTSSIDPRSSRVEIEDRLKVQSPDS